MGSNISIHSPLTGRDARHTVAAFVSRDFNPLSPHGERLVAVGFFAWAVIFQSTLPSRGETLGTRWPLLSAEISIHSPLTGRDFCHFTLLRSTYGFQSTLPSRGETTIQYINREDLIDFNPLSPHGERRPENPRTFPHYPISIHSPLTGRDLADPPQKPRRSYFNPLSPHGERQPDSLNSVLDRIFQSTLPSRGETN